MLIYATNPFTGFLEPFLLGVSCLIGGDQYTIMMSHTNLSITAQIWLLIATFVITLFCFPLIDLKSKVEFNYSLILYTISSVFVLIFVGRKATRPFWACILTVFFGCVLTILILGACVNYCTSRPQILSFIFGIFVSRVIPSIFWLFAGKIPYKSKLLWLSTSMASCRFVLTLLTILIKILNGTFDVWYKSTDKNPLKNYSEFTTRFNIKSLYGSTYVSFHSWSNCIPNTSFLPLVMFIVFVVFYLCSPPTLGSGYHNFSIKLQSSLSLNKIIFHLLGSAFGIGFPVALTGNNFLLYLLGMFSLTSFLLGVLHYFRSKLGYNLLHITIIIIGFSSGYVWAYCLGAFVTSSLNQTCEYYETAKNACCLDRVKNECYCKYRSKANISKGEKDTAQTNGKLFECSKLCCGEKSLTYDKAGQNAVVILVEKSAECNCNSTTCACPGTSSTDQNCCLKVLCTYELKSVTTSSCGDCHLTVRLEAKKYCNCPSCASGGTSDCTCSSGKCCCICVCSPKQGCQCGTANNCCCFKFCQKCNGDTTCCCKNGGCSTSCNSNKNGCVRVFIAHKNGTSNGCCCIKEIKPNSNSDFDGNLEVKNSFDIRDIFVANCCHTDLHVDLHCKVRNNFFRLGGINYSKKYTRPTSLTFRYPISKCCKKTDPKCCCAYREYVGLCLKHDGDASTNCNNAGSCSTGDGGEGCCKTPCCLKVHEKSAFYKTIDDIKISLVVVCCLFFGLIFIIAALITLYVHSNIYPYHFDPKVTYDELIATLNKYNLGSEHVKLNLESLAQTIQSGGGRFNRQESLNEMLDVFKRSMTEADHIKLTNYLFNASKSMAHSGILKKLDSTAIMWTHCVSVVFAQALILLPGIQEFFNKWEELWKVELKHYVRFIKPTFTREANESIFSLTAVANTEVTRQDFDKASANRLASWRAVLNELWIYSLTNSSEVDKAGDTIPMRLFERLMYLLSRWRHRIRLIDDFRHRDTNIMDWTQFLEQYRKIDGWFDSVHSHTIPVNDLTIDNEELNKNLKAFAEHKLE